MPTISEAIEIFSTEFQFEAGTNTRRSYISALNTWRYYLKHSHISVLKTDLSTLQPDVITRFSGWMREAKPQSRSRKTAGRTGKDHFSPSTIRLYQQALLRALGFWRSRGWISFYAAEEVATRTSSTIRTRKKASAQNRRASRVPSDFGLRMVSAALRDPLPSSGPKYYLLDALRSRVLICILASTGLRISDARMLVRQHFEKAQSSNGLIRVSMRKTGELAYPVLSPNTLKVISMYLEERSDNSPYLLISHGRGPLNKKKPVESRTEYGEPLSYGTAYKIVKDIAALAYPKSSSKAFLSPHAFRHWHSQQLIDQGARLEDVQSILGHANPSTTKETYAPKPNIAGLINTELSLQILLDASFRS
jgi:integrase